MTTNSSYMKTLTILCLAAAFAFVAARSVRAQGGPPRGEPVAGMSCDAMEGSRLHIHQHLTILDHGKEVAVPPNVGQPAEKRCIYWVHTHTPDGVIHVASPGGEKAIGGDNASALFTRALASAGQKCPIRYIAFGTTSNDLPWGPLFDLLVAVDRVKAAGDARYVLGERIERQK